MKELKGKKLEERRKKERELLKTLNETKKTDINEIILLAFRKYKLSGKKSMNTFVFTQTKLLSEEDYDKILDTLESKIKEYEEKKRQKAEEEMQKEIEKVLKII